MKIVTVSPKFQVVIPQIIRDSLKLKAGEKICVFQYENRIEYIPQKKLKEMRGFLKGMDTELVRDDDRI
jgi:AbrB family looped-hinge helix DNA binding protein